jgi:predicted ATPase
MRVAFSGAHRTGKTTLLQAVHARMPHYDSVEEPYRLLEGEGYEFSDPPSVEDFGHQLGRSIETIRASGVNTLLDRCPLDAIAYLQAIDDGFDIAEHLDAIAASMTMLDLVVLVSIEMPDRIDVPSNEDRRLRRRVDRSIQRLLFEDPYGWEVRTLEVAGSLDQRVAQVLRAMER